MAYTSIVFIFFLFLFPLSALSQSIGTVAVGSILTADEKSRPWLSPSRDFAFGFKPLQDKDQFLLSIWYNKIPDKTAVWYVNSINQVPRGSTIELHAQTGLTLRDPQGQVLWRPDGVINQADHGFMNDTGNFILKGVDEAWLWESFGLPADTILPSQELVTGKFLNSRKSDNNFSGGRFYMRFRDNGNLVLTSQSVPTNTNEDAVYYDSQTNDSLNVTNSGYRVIFDSRGSLYVLKRNSQTKQLSPVSVPPASENYHRVTLDFDGVFTFYSHPKTFTGNPSWNVLWSLPDNICKDLTGDKGSGACGFNNICFLQNKRPVCECPTRYNLVDPNDKYGSCQPNFTLTCDEFEQSSAADLYDFEVRSDVDWPLSDYEQIDPANETACRQACLQDCFCVVAIFRDNSCWKKKLPLSNGKIDTSLQSIAFMKYPISNAPPPYPSPGSKPKDRETLIIVGSVLLSSSLFVNFILIGTLVLGFHLVYKRKVQTRSNIVDVETNLRCFTFKELAEATSRFKEELGRGSFGIVYKGALALSSGNFAVAVKKLDRLVQDAEKEFRAEVNSIGQTNHKNLVRLLGFCDEGTNRLLVYEYISNGTLTSFIFADQKPSWNLRKQIAIGIARGLVYLHEECCMQIIHCDIKPHNILLDDYYNARICDFGLAKLLTINQSRTTLSNVRGTRGYVAPEWFRNSQITAKVDVYSFGVVLLEIISCRQCLNGIGTVEGDSDIPLTELVWNCFQEGRLDSFVENDMNALNDKMTLERFVMVSIWCIQEDSSLRPTMRMVSQMLEGTLQVMVPPCPYTFSCASID